MSQILETPRTILREMTGADAEFILDLLNQPSFIEFIGDRNVRTVEQAREYIESRFIESYKIYGYGLWLVELKTDKTPIGICGFVKRDSLPDADIGFAFLQSFERQGYGYECSSATMDYGKNVLHLARILAITSQHNDASGRLLNKIGFNFERLIDVPHSSEKLKLFSAD